MAQPGAYKVVFLGTGSVGKSSLVLRFVTDTFTKEYLPTIEDLYRKTCLFNGTPAHLDILDTAGQEEFLAARDEWVRGGKAFFLVYSITSMQSFKEVDQFRQHILQVHDGQQVPMVLVGNKSDLEAEREVPSADGAKLATLYGNIPFLETSALTGSNCDQIFYEAVRLIREKEGDATRQTQTQRTKKKWRCTIL